MGLRDLRRAAIRTFAFRRPEPGESDAAYYRALLRHVETRDFAAAHELRVGRPQADWTPGDHQAFFDHLRQPGAGVSMDFDGPRAFLTLHDAGPHPVTDDSILALATAGLDALMQMRREQPTNVIAIMGSVLLLDGSVLTTTVARKDRLAWIKMMVRDHPVYGYFLGFDAFLHQMQLHPVTRAVQGSSKRDAVLMHVGTRTCRHVLQRPYTVTHGVAVFDDPPPPPIETPNMEDPYAEVFVSVPTGSERPS